MANLCIMYLECIYVSTRSLLLGRMICFPLVVLHAPRHIA